MSGVDDLLGESPAVRRSYLRTLSAHDIAILKTACTAEQGTPYILYHDDPVGFTEDVCGEFLWSKQQAVLNSTVTNRRTVAVSSHAVGKSHLAARRIAHHVCTSRPGSAMALSTAPTFRQVRHVLWPHIHRLHERAGLPGTLNQVEWKGDDGSMVAFGFSSAAHDESAVQGIHAEKLLIVVDEAGGIPTILGRNLDSIMTGTSTLLAIGNPPTDDAGTWFETIALSSLWSQVHISAFDSPNFTGERCPIEIRRNLVDDRWVDDIRRQYGEDDPYFIARVLAQFPKNSSRRVVPVAWAEAAIVKPGEDDPTMPASDWVRLGVDVAGGGGDEMVVALLDGWRIKIAEVWSGADTADQYVNAERVLEWIRRAEGMQAQRGYNDKKVRVKIDCIGIGAGTTDVLRRMGKDGLHGADIVGVNVAEAATDAAKFANRRAECWWAMREVTRDGTLRLEIGEKELRQLTTPSFRDDTAGGRILIESKDKLKARGLNSPDRADALCLAVYEPVPVTRTVSFAGQLRSASPLSRVGSVVPR